MTIQDKQNLRQVQYLLDQTCEELASVEKQRDIAIKYLWDITAIEGAEKIAIEALDKMGVEVRS